jgi:Lar family restriction alleviation protein
MTDAPLLPCPWCGDAAKVFRHGVHKYDYTIVCGACQFNTKHWRTEAEAIAAWNRGSGAQQSEPVPSSSPTSEREKRLEEALDRYRYAIAWVGADSWDHCDECRARLEWARSMDGRRLSDDEIAAVGKQYLGSALSSPVQQKE